MRRAARVVAATAAVSAALTTALVAPAAPAAADPLPNGPMPWTVSTSASNGVFTVNATCSFGPFVWPGRPESFEFEGVAVAPGAIATRITCSARTDRTAIVGAPVAAVAGRDLWEGIAEFCVSAVGAFTPEVVVTAPQKCVPV